MAVVGWEGGDVKMTYSSMADVRSDWLEHSQVSRILRHAEVKLCHLGSTIFLLLNPAIVALSMSCP